MPMEEKALLPVAYWKASGDNTQIACTLAAMGQMESNQKVRAWFPEAKQNMDTLGTHNDVLCLELWREGLVTDSRYWRKSQQWPRWRRLFQERPDMGTMIAGKAFARLAGRFGIDNSVQMWKTGKVGTVPGLEYLMQVKIQRAKLMKLCRQ